MTDEKAEKAYELYQNRLLREYDNLNQRVTWHLISQSFFYTAYTAIINAPENARNDLLSRQHTVLLWALPIMGLGVGVLTFPAIASSMIFLGHLQHRIKSFSFGGTPLPHERQSLQYLSNLSAIFLSLVIVAGWIVIFSNQI